MALSYGQMHELARLTGSRARFRLHRGRSFTHGHDTRRYSADARRAHLALMWAAATTSLHFFRSPAR